LDDALEYSKEYLKLSEEIGDMEGVATAHISLGIDYLNLKRYKEALSHLEVGLKLGADSENELVLKSAYEGLKKAYAEVGNYKMAYNFALLYQQANDTIFNQNSSRQIAEMQTKYETEKKEQQIILLEKDSVIQQASLENQKLIRNAGIASFFILAFVVGLVFNRYKLKQENDRNLLEKNVAQTENQLLRAQMNPHFIFNSLNSIQSYVADHKSGLGQEYLADFAILMRIILENSSKEFVSLSTELESLGLYMKLEQLRFEGKFEYTIQVDPEVEQDLIEIPPMIIQPFVENAILHGVMNKTEKGRIDVSITETSNQLVCVVTDDGIGRAASAQLGRKKKHKSMGLDVTKNRIKLLTEELGVSGGVDIEDLNDDNGQSCGTSVKITIPIA
jgi:tetratricopeptide (TPR) repeat protein